MIWSACEALFDPVLTHGKRRKDVCENTAKGRQGKEWLQIANFRILSLFIDNSNNCPLGVVTAGGNILNCYRHYRSVKLNISDVVPKKAKKTDTMFQKDKFKLHFGHCFDLSRGGSRGRVQGVCTPPPWDDLRFSNTTGVLQKKKNYVFYWCWSRARDECTPS